MRLLPRSPASDMICGTQPTLHLILTDLSGVPSPKVSPNAAQKANSQARRTTASWHLPCSGHLRPGNSAEVSIAALHPLN